MASDDELAAEADQLARLLRSRNLRAVFAESCTAGLVSATLARTPGISDQLCGSAVAYRDATKQCWLNVSAADLGPSGPGPVSSEVAVEMAEGVLRITPEADLAASVTGHLGPDAPEPLDGLMFTAVAIRGDEQGGPPASVRVQDFRLREVDTAAENSDGNSLRVARQRAAAQTVLQFVRVSIEEVF